MRQFFNAGVCLVAFAGLAACETTTVGEGRLGGKAVTFQVVENTFSDGAAEATATLPNGTVYTGKLVTAKTETTNVGEEPFGYGFGGFDDFDGFDDGFDDFDDGPYFVSTFSTTYSPYAKGVLFSGKRAMRCVITLSNPAGGFADGGVGGCKLSGGGTIPVEF